MFWTRLHKLSHSAGFPRFWESSNKTNKTKSGTCSGLRSYHPAKNLHKLTVEGLEISKNFTVPFTVVQTQIYTYAQPGDQFIDYESSVFTFASCVGHILRVRTAPQERKTSTHQVVTTTNDHRRHDRTNTTKPKYSAFHSTILTFSLQRYHHHCHPFCCLLSSREIFIHAPTLHTSPDPQTLLHHWRVDASRNHSFWLIYR